MHDALFVRGLESGGFLTRVIDDGNGGKRPGGLWPSTSSMTMAFSSTP